MFPGAVGKPLQLSQSAKGLAHYQPHFSGFDAVCVFFSEVRLYGSGHSTITLAAKRAKVNGDLTLLQLSVVG
jgi:hypothetical protein